MICKNENVPHYCTDFDFLGGDNQKCRFYIGVVEVLDEKVPHYCTELDFLGGGRQQQQRPHLGGSAFRARVATTLDKKRYHSAAEWGSHAPGPPTIIIIKN